MPSNPLESATDQAQSSGQAPIPAQGQAPRPPLGDGDSLNNSQPHTGGEIRKKGGKRPGAGRPKGSKNLSTLAREGIGDKFVSIGMKGKRAEKVFEKLFEMAQEGDIQAIKMVVDKFVPNADKAAGEKVKDFGIQIG